MKALDDAGIYLLLVRISSAHATHPLTCRQDVNTPQISINRENPEPSYNEKYLQHVFATIDVFSKYDNTLAFFTANEVINDVTTTPGATYVKAVTRDMHRYMKERKIRAVPIGYSAADVTENRLQAADYFNCGDDELARSDFFAVCTLPPIPCV